MKKALILHGTNGNSNENWFPWLKEELEKNGYEVWVPDLPGSDKPNIQRYNQYIFGNKDWTFDSDTVLIGHSSGAVAILGLLQALPSGSMVKGCYLIGSFRNDLKWDALKELFNEPFNFDLIKEKSRLFYFLHSDNDPYCPLDHAEYLHEKIGGDLIVLPGQKHFSVGTYGEAYRKFPYLLHLIVGDSMREADVVDLYTSLEKMDIKIWLDGGWGVDALLEKQTRPHGDMDIVAQKKDVPSLIEFLQKRGYGRVKRGDETEWNFIMGDKDARFIDFHVIELDENGNGIYGAVEKGVMYDVNALTGKGKVGGVDVNCISPEWMVKFHTGYVLRPSDYHDVKALCQKFNIELPKEYEQTKETNV